MALEIGEFSAIKLGLASPEQIRLWSEVERREKGKGEVTKPETINYKTGRPERDGLFCERIFGPTKDWECYCGKYKKERYKGIICDRCGVEITKHTVRRERMGYINLAAPVSHIWYFKGVPSRMALILDISPRALEKVLYFSSYIVIFVDKTRLEKKEEEIKKAIYESIKNLEERFEEKIKEIEEKIADAFSEDTKKSKNEIDVLLQQKQEEISEIEKGKELLFKLTERQLLSEQEHRCLKKIKKILEEKKIITEKQVLFKVGIGGEAIKEMLKNLNIEKLKEELRNELKESSNRKNKKDSKLIRRLEVVEAFYKSKQKPEWMVLEVLPVIPPELRPMVQISGGRYASADLNDLYRRVINRNNRLKKLIELEAPEVIINNEKRMLQEAVDALLDNGKRGRPITDSNNRPYKSLSDILRGKQGRFRQNLLGKRVDYSGRSVIVVGPKLKIYQCGLPKEMALELFKPFVMKKLVDKGIAHNIKVAKKMIERMNTEVWDALEEIIKSHPVLLNRAPTLHRLGIQAFEPVLIEGKAIQIHPLVCAAFNADFDGDQMAVHVPLSLQAQMESRILMLSAYNLLSPANGKPLATPSQDIVLGIYYATIEDIRENPVIEVNISTTKVIGEYLAEDIPEIGIKGEKIDFKLYKKIKDSKIKKIKIYRIPCFASGEEVELAYHFKSIKLHQKIRLKIQDFPLKVNFEDREVLYVKSFSDVKEEIIGKNIVSDVFNPITGDILLKNKQKITEKSLEILKENRVEEIVVEDPIDNRIFVYSCGLLETTTGRVLFNQKLPKNLRFINKVLDKKSLANLVEKCYYQLGISETIYLLDSLKEEGFEISTKSGITIGIDDLEGLPEKEELLKKADVNVDKVEQQFKKGIITKEERYERIINIWQQTTDELTERLLNKLDKFNPLFMMADSGARGAMHQVRQLVGMRGLTIDPSGRIIEFPIRTNFKEGMSVLEYFISTHGARKGLADTALKTADAGYLTRRLVDVVQDVVIKEEDCKTKRGIEVSEVREGDEIIQTFRERVVGRYTADKIVHPKTGEVILKQNQEITEEIFEYIESLGIKSVKIRSVLTCNSKKGICQKCYGRNMATGRLVDIGEAVGIVAAQSIGEPGTQLTLRTFHTGGVHGEADITQGLPRVEELFEARKPKGMAIISEIDGIVNIYEREGREIIKVVNERDEKEYIVPYGVRIKVKNGEEISAGTQLTEGSINPHDLLRIKGMLETQLYLLKEVQKVYKLQGVDINDKHIEVVIRQLTRKVKIEDPGDLDFLPDEIIDIFKFEEENEKAAQEGKKKAKAKPLLLGVTKASLLTESFLSAASFQETTRVLTDAVIKGEKDNLTGLKENVIIGNLIPAGTGMPVYRDLILVEEEKVSEEESASAGK
jgi:DNA-directed RNA polymerase subunit beta'